MSALIDWEKDPTSFWQNDLYKNIYLYNRIFFYTIISVIRSLWFINSNDLIFNKNRGNLKFVERLQKKKKNYLKNQRNKIFHRSFHFLTFFHLKIIYRHTRPFFSSLTWKKSLVTKRRVCVGDLIYLYMIRYNNIFFFF